MHESRGARDWWCTRVDVHEIGARVRSDTREVHEIGARVWSDAREVHKYERCTRLVVHEIGARE